MSAVLETRVVPAPVDAEKIAQLRDLYASYKRLVLSVGAALAMGRETPGADAAAQLLLVRCDRAAEGAGTALEEQFRACVDAARGLSELAACRDASQSDCSRLEAVRRQHRRLRRLVWDVVGCEYAPCGAGPHLDSVASGACGGTSGRSEQ